MGAASLSDLPEYKISFFSVLKMSLKQRHGCYIIILLFSISLSLLVWHLNTSYPGGGGGGGGGYSDIFIHT